MKRSKKVYTPEKKNDTFTNSRGDTFKLFPMNPLEEQVIQQQIEDEWVAAGKTLPVPPAYEALTAAGEVQRITLNKREDADTPELQVAWDAYEADNKELQAAFTESFMVSCFLCIDANPDNYPAWKSRMKLLKRTIPDDEGEKLLLFCRTWVMRSNNDIAELVFAVTSTVANVSEEAMEAARGMFRRQMEKAASSIQSAA